MKAMSWGRYPRVAQSVVGMPNRHEPLPLPPEGSVLAHGFGRSYGDSCLNGGGTLIDTTSLDRFISFDRQTGEIACETGVSLAEIIDVALPHGWFLPVTPGTKFVTLGGAIANDVHGKNHHREGTIGRHIRGFELLRSDGTRLSCSPAENADYFAATIGGLGLTGLITRATLQLKRVGSSYVAGQSIKFGGLDEFFVLSAESAASHEYVVSWIDCLGRGETFGRGHFLRANVLDADAAGGIKARRPLPLAVPVMPPMSLVNRWTLKAFNAAYYNRQTPRIVERVWTLDAFHYPLDAIANWNRIYGPRGFLQYQAVVPARDQRDVSEALLAEIGRSGQGSFLVVFKVFGDLASPGLLSFPMPGTTLALDFPILGEKTFALLDRLDAIVMEAGGRLYPAKDARMSPACFGHGYPQRNTFRNFVDPRFGSSFARRVMENA
ncbi:FAD-binding oxidoreductase [Parvibaculum sp.]|uniref:FAD-binding oxidoreductase n=1 Tax=Parvibaculum sp. TaxID=2024848 RepID=UPI002CF9E3F3|nr:FAD-binding oxidoreductase [Parvibaculum sp.]HUD51420.1 FAD-binding oxidoreductase [Parvibaculum sp.]